MNVDYRKAVPRVLTLLLAVFMAAALSERGEAQVLYGSLVGNVRDSSGAAIPGATVTITNKETNLTRETLTSDTGAYTLANILAGTYSVKVTLTGFKEFSKTDVPVTVNTITRVDVMLEVGQLAETVTVAADAVRLQTDKADLHVDLNTKEITDLPLSNYRNYQTLINLVPGATPGRFQNANTDTPARALTTNVNGTNRNNNNTRIDGSTSVFIFLPHHTAYVAPAETIETVNISTNNFDAEQGMAGGAAITLVTKAGTNDVHGSVFALHDNSAVRAKNFFLPTGLKKPNSIQNIDGFTLGGPIVKDKLFYFGGWEGTRERVARGFNTRFTLATEDQRRGDFSRYDTVIYDPLTGNPDGTGRTPFPSNIIPENRISPITRKMQDLVPLPNLPGVTNNFSRSATQAMNRDNFDVKLNWNRTTANQVWAKFSMMPRSAVNTPLGRPEAAACATAAPVSATRRSM